MLTRYSGWTLCTSSRPAIRINEIPTSRPPSASSHHHPSLFSALHPTNSPSQSHAVIAGPNIFVSGCIPADSTGALVTGSIATQTKACCENIKAILSEAGADMTRVVKVNVFLTDMGNFAEMNETYAEYFAHKPARSCVAVKELPKGVPVEIECVAYVGKNAGGSPRL